MLRPANRILCVDSSATRLEELTETLLRAGFDVWTAQGASDAVCLACGLSFDVLVMDQASSLARPEIWDSLAESQPRLPILVHSGPPKSKELCRHLRLVSPAQPARSPEVVLALLLLMLGEGDGKNPKLRPRPLAAA